MLLNSLNASSTETNMRRFNGLPIGAGMIGEASHDRARALRLMQKSRGGMFLKVPSEFPAKSLSTLLKIKSSRLNVRGRVWKKFQNALLILLNSSEDLKNARALFLMISILIKMKRGSFLDIRHAL